MTEQFSDLSKQVESTDFRFLANQASSFRMFQRILDEDDTFRQLVGFAKTRNGALAILERILALAAIRDTNVTENPNDTALATYLMALDAAAFDYTHIVALVLRRRSNLWWSRKAANAIVERVASTRLAPHEDTIVFTFKQRDVAYKATASEDELYYTVPGTQPTTPVTVVALGQGASTTSEKSNLLSLWRSLSLFSDLTMTYGTKVSGVLSAVGISQ